MAAIAAASIAGGASLIGGMMSNQSSARQAAINRDWETQMSNTQMQRRVTDLKAAGLNPMLAYTQGGASSPTASAPQMSNVAGPAAEAGISAYSAANQKALQDAQKDLIAKQADAQGAAADKTRSDTSMNQFLVGKILAETGATSAQEGLTRANTIVAGGVPAVQQSDILRNTAGAKASDASSVALLASANQSNAETGLIKQKYAEVQAQVENILADTDLKSANTDQVKQVTPLLVSAKILENKLTSLGLPAAQNVADFQSSWWGKHIAPYLPDVLKSAAGGAAGATVVQKYLQNKKDNAPSYGMPLGGKK